MSDRAFSPDDYVALAVYLSREEDAHDTRLHDEYVTSLEREYRTAMMERADLLTERAALRGNLTTGLRRAATLRHRLMVERRWRWGLVFALVCGALWAVQGPQMALVGMVLGGAVGAARR